MTIGNPTFCLFLYLTGVHFRGELQHCGDVSRQKIKCQPIKTPEIGGVHCRTYYMVDNRDTSFVKKIVNKMMSRIK